MRDESHHHRHADGKATMWFIGITIFVIFILFFGPLIASLIEMALFRTTKVEDCCRSLGVHGFYETLYRPLGWLVEKFL